jgi:pimeloyl-ACP methyl ester carboxylesterase
MPRPTLAFAPPTGPFAIGTVTHHVVDRSRPEVLGPDPDARRELMLQLWYPAREDPRRPFAPYLPDADVVLPELAGFLGVPTSALDPVRTCTTNAVGSAPVADHGDPYPVLIVLVGIKGSYPQVQTFQVEELASHGYVVVAIDQPTVVAAVRFPDGRVVTYDDRWDPPHSAFMDDHLAYLARDVSAALDHVAAIDREDPSGILTGRLDLSRVGLVGHSLGAIVGAEACHLDPRVGAAVLEDARMPADVVRYGLRQPVMFITRDADTMRLERRTAGGWPESDIEETLSTMRSVYDRLPGDGSYVLVPGMFHLDMTDAALLSPFVPWPGLAGPLGAGRVHRIVNAYSLALFERELRGRRPALLDGPSERFGDVVFERRR